MKLLERSGGLLAIFLLLTATAWGQGWQMFAEQIKEEAAVRRQQEKTGSEPVVPGHVGQSVGGKKAAGIIPSGPEQVNAASEDTEPGGTATGETATGEIATGEQEPRIGDDTPLSESLPDVAQAPSLPGTRDFPEMKSDATLWDICITPGGVLWAVGDRGTIVASADGGHHWSLIRSPVDGDLYGVRFWDEKSGVIVGGRLLPTGDGQGIVLRTTDGGATWQESPTHAFPILRQLELVPDGRLFAAGDSTELYPGGLFFSEDGGQTWSAEQGNRHEGWAGIAYQSDSHLGIGIGTGGTVQRTNRGRCEEECPGTGTSRFGAVAQGSPQEPVRIVGTRGLVLESSDLGSSWRSLSTSLSGTVTELFDFKAVCSQGSCLWVAGEPGSVIFKSGDGGQSWLPVQTGIEMAIRRIRFRDANYGWALADLGTILLTTDGGRSWQVARQGGNRTALLGLYGETKAIPWELFIRYCGEEGYLGAIAFPARQDDQAGEASLVTSEQRIRDALIDSGASTVSFTSKFLLDSPELSHGIDGILARFDRENDRKGIDAFRSDLVQKIRTFRPSVILIDSPESSPIAELIHRELPGAIQAAADPLSCPEQLQDGFLSVWTVDKVCSLAPPGLAKESDLIFDSAFYCPTLGRSVQELARSVRSLVQGNGEVPEKTRVTVLYDRAVASETGAPVGSGATNSRPGLFSGVNSVAVGEGRRKVGPGFRENRESLARRASDLRQKEGIATRYLQAKEGERTGDVLLSRLPDMIRGTDPAAGTGYLLDVAQQFRNEGNWTAAEEVYLYLIKEYPGHAATREAYLWLIPWYAGSEPTRRAVAHRRDSGTGATGITAQADGITGERETRLRHAEELGKQVRQDCPDLYMDPRIRFPLAATARLQGWTKTAVSYYMNRSLISRDDLWGRRAEAEYWLATPNKEQLSDSHKVCPIAVLNCRAVSTRPKLDGVLEPEFWGQSELVSLSAPRPDAPNGHRLDDIWDRSPESEKYAQNFGSAISLLYDEQYLYLGLLCEKKEGVDYTNDEKPRSRDGARSDADRIEVQLDSDRDYVTGYRFVFDYNGRVAESLWEDSSWNPRLYVAHRQDETTWTVEAAIPWSELADRAPARSEVWGISVRRIIPHTGIECWNADFSDKGRDGFGFLTFGF